jgi:O-antigen ligase
MDDAETRTKEHTLEARLAVPRVRLSWLVRLALLLLPVWWFLGLEQFIWPLIFVPLAGMLVYSRAKEGRGIVLPAASRWALLFLAVQLISALFIVETSWYLVFARNLALWVGGASLYLLTVNLFPFGSEAFDRLLRTVALMTLFCCIAAYLAVLNIVDVQFVSPLAKVLPPVIANSEFAQAILDKSWSALEATTIFGIRFGRPRSFFTYPNPFAGYLVLTLPLLVYGATRQASRKGRWLWIGLAALAGSTLIITTSRAGIVSLLGAVIFVRQKLAARWRFLLYAALACALLVGVGVILEYSLSQESLVEWGELLVTARGKSHLTRMAVYTATLESWLERPLFGWGTQRTPTAGGLTPNYPPLGSHSTYIAVLYRHGLVGFAVFAAMIAAVIRQLYRRGLSRPAKEFVLFLRWAVIGSLLHIFLLEIDLDATLLATMWLVWGLVAVATRRERALGPPGEAETVET